MNASQSHQPTMCKLMKESEKNEVEKESEKEDAEEKTEDNLYMSRTTLGWYCQNPDLDQLVNRFEMFGKVVNVTTADAYKNIGRVEFADPRSVNRALRVKLDGIELHRIDMDPNSSEFINKSQEWLSYFVSFQERKYVFTEVAWAMYQLIPTDLRPKFWLQFENERFIEKRDLILSFMIYFTLKSMEREDVLEVVLACSEYKSLVQRTQHAINTIAPGLIQIDIKRLHDQINYLQITYSQRSEVQMSDQGCMLYYGGKSFLFRADLELTEAVWSVSEMMADDHYTQKDYEKFLKIIKHVLSLYPGTSDPKIRTDLDELIRVFISKSD